MDFVFPDSRSDRYNKGKIIGPVLYLVHTFCSWWFWAIVLKTERISSNFKCHTYLAHPLFGMDSRTHTLQPLRYRFHEWLFTRARNPRYLIDLREGGCQFKMKFGCVNTHPVLSRCTWCLIYRCIWKAMVDMWHLILEYFATYITKWYLKLLEMRSTTWGSRIFFNDFRNDFHASFNSSRPFEHFFIFFYLFSARLYNAHQHQSWNTSLAFWKPLDLLLQEIRWTSRKNGKICSFTEICISLPLECMKIGGQLGWPTLGHLWFHLISSTERSSSKLRFLEPELRQKHLKSFFFSRTPEQGTYGATTVGLGLLGSRPGIGWVMKNIHVNPGEIDISPRHLHLIAWSFSSGKCNPSNDRYL